MTTPSRRSSPSASPLSLAFFVLVLLVPRVSEAAETRADPAPDRAEEATLRERLEGLEALRLENEDARHELTVKDMELRLERARIELRLAEVEGEKTLPSFAGASDHERRRAMHERTLREKALEVEQERILVESVKLLAPLQREYRRRYGLAGEDDHTLDAAAAALLLRIESLRYEQAARQRELDQARVDLRYRDLLAEASESGQELSENKLVGIADSLDALELQATYEEVCHELRVAQLELRIELAQDGASLDEAKEQLAPLSAQIELLQAERRRSLEVSPAGTAVTGDTE